MKNLGPRITELCALRAPDPCPSLMNVLYEVSGTVILGKSLQTGVWPQLCRGVLGSILSESLGSTTLLLTWVQSPLKFPANQ